MRCLDINVYAESNGVSLMEANPQRLQLPLKLEDFAPICTNLIAYMVVVGLVVQEHINDLLAYKYQSVGVLF
jgi:hypothetical protein